MREIGFAAVVAHRSTIGRAACKYAGIWRSEFSTSIDFQSTPTCCLSVREDPGLTASHKIPDASHVDFMLCIPWPAALPHSRTGCFIGVCFGFLVFFAISCSVSFCIFTICSCVPHLLSPLSPFSAPRETRMLKVDSSGGAPSERQEWRGDMQSIAGSRTLLSSSAPPPTVFFSCWICCCTAFDLCG